MKKKKGLLFPFFCFVATVILPSVIRLCFINWMPRTGYSCNSNHSKIIANRTEIAKWTSFIACGICPCTILQRIMCSRSTSLKVDNSPEIGSAAVDSNTHKKTFNSSTRSFKTLTSTDIYIIRHSLNQKL